MGRTHVLREGTSGLTTSSRIAISITGLLASLFLFQTTQAAATIARAAQEGDLDQLTELIADGAEVNEAASDGSTALLWAAYQSYPAMVTALLDAGADVDAANRLGVTPLLQASRTGDAPVIELLLAAGADIDAATLNGETPLMAAARAGSIDSVRLLLDHGTDPNATEDFEGQTALMWAAAEGHTEVVGLLLEAGADPDIQARVNALTERSVRTDFPTGGFTAAMWAARNGHEATLARLAAGGADLALTNGDGATASMVAIVNDRFDLAAKMLDMGADPDDGSLYYAVLMRDATTDWRAKDGSRLRVDYPNELTALDLTRVLLEAGADPNKLFVGQMHSSSMCCDTAESGTPFYRAAVAADVAALELLVAHGADVEWTPENIEDAPRGANGNAGKSPLTAALNGGKGVGMAGGPGDIREGSDPPFREEANREPADAMRVLLEAGADPNRRTGNGSTLLHDAGRARNLDAIRLLAEFDVELDALNSDGLTALDVAEGRRADGERRPGGFGGGFAPGGGFGSPDGPTQEDVAALLRELMESSGVPIVEHGVLPAEDDA
jgi:ankyrin repeat protein